MIQFMVIAAPRSGTAWAANWLTTDTTLCFHDPLWKRHYQDLDAIQSTKMLGVACTGLHLFGAYLRAHPARKVILHRERREVEQSLAEIGMSAAPAEQLFTLLDDVDGYHCPWTDLFEKPAPIYEHLLQRPFDAERHRALLDLEVQTNFEGIQVNREATARLMAELQAIAAGRLQ